MHSDEHIKGKLDLICRTMGSYIECIEFCQLGEPGSYSLTFKTCNDMFGISPVYEHDIRTVPSDGSEVAECWCDVRQNGKWKDSLYCGIRWGATRDSDSLYPDTSTQIAIRRCLRLIWENREFLSLHFE